MQRGAEINCSRCRRMTVRPRRNVTVMRASRPLDEQGPHQAPRATSGEIGFGSSPPFYEQHFMNSEIDYSSTYGHSQLKTGHPVRSAIHKQLNGRLVLRWVTTWESLLLYVLFPDLF